MSNKKPLTSAAKQKHREANKRYFLKNRQRIQENRNQYYRANPMAEAIRNAQTRAKKKGLPFNLVKEDLIIPEYCPILGLKLAISNGKRMIWNSPSLDRIIPSKGYTKDNVRVVSLRANLLKSDATLEECRLILKDLEKIYENN